MLYRDRNSQEGYIHICDDANRYRKDYIKNRPQILVHDCNAHLMIENKLIDIKFCPYCGKKIEDEIETATNEFYKF